MDSDDSSGFWSIKSNIEFEIVDSSRFYPLHPQLTHIQKRSDFDHDQVDAAFISFDETFVDSKVATQY